MGYLFCLSEIEWYLSSNVTAMNALVNSMLSLSLDISSLPSVSSGEERGVVGVLRSSEEVVLVSSGCNCVVGLWFGRHGVMYS